MVENSIFIEFAWVANVIWKFCRFINMHANGTAITFASSSNCNIDTWNDDKVINTIISLCCDETTSELKLEPRAVELLKGWMTGCTVYVEDQLVVCTSDKWRTNCVANKWQSVAHCTPSNEKLLEIFIRYNTNNYYYGRASVFVWQQLWTLLMKVIRSRKVANWSWLRWLLVWTVCDGSIRANIGRLVRIHIPL